jgi:phospholipid/cholesterol/gamma-HCH transport system substrate-binding protein
VTFSGVPVGSIEDITLKPDSPEFVRVKIKVREGTPILVGTTATIAGVGFTGVSQINLDGATRGAAPIACTGSEDPSCPDGLPVIPTKPGALGALLNSAPLLLDKVTTLTDRLGQLLDPANRQSIGNILGNVDRLSGSLADRGPEIAATLAETRIAGPPGRQRRRTDRRPRPKHQRAPCSVTSPPPWPISTRRRRAHGPPWRRSDATIADARPGLKGRCPIRRSRRPIT